MPPVNVSPNPARVPSPLHARFIRRSFFQSHSLDFQPLARCSYHPPSPSHSALLLWAAAVGISCDEWSSHSNCIRGFILFHLCFYLFSHELYKIHPDSSRIGHHVKRGRRHKRSSYIRRHSNIHFTGHFTFFSSRTQFSLSLASRRC